MNLIDKVKNSLKWKRSTYYCAAKLGISVEKYKELKRQLKMNDVTNDPIKN